MQYEPPRATPALRKRTFMSTFADWLECARSASSSYNSQPWHFKVQPEGHIDVGWDAARTLPASDPTGRDLFLGLGAAIESACLRAAAAGKPLAFEPAAGQNDATVGRLVWSGAVAFRLLSCCATVASRLPSFQPAA